MCDNFDMIVFFPPAVDGGNTTSVNRENPLPAANVQLPPETFENISDPSVGLVFTVYQVGSLFPVESAMRDEGFIVGSLVLGVSVAEMSVANLSQPVVVTLQIDPNRVVGMIRCSSLRSRLY